jgi:hypothetical protein
MTAYKLDRYSTLSDKESSLELSFCSPSLFNKLSQPVFSQDYNDDEEVLLERLGSGEYQVQREIYAKHPVCDLWREYIVFDSNAVLSMPPEFLSQFHWHKAISICSITKVAHPIKLAVPRSILNLNWKELSLRNMGAENYDQAHERHFLGVDEDVESITYVISNSKTINSAIFRLENDPRNLTFISFEFLNWLLTIVPKQGFFTVREPVME